MAFHWSSDSHGSFSFRMRSIDIFKRNKKRDSDGYLGYFTTNLRSGGNFVEKNSVSDPTDFVAYGIVHVVADDTSLIGADWFVATSAV